MCLNLVESHNPIDKSARLYCNKDNKRQPYNKFKS